MGSLARKQRLFVETYLTCWNATEAAGAAGYAHPRQAGSRLLSNVDVKEAVEARLKEKALGADEVLARLADIARGDMGDFLDISALGFQVDLEKAKEKGLTKLIRKVKQRTVTTLAKDVETETNEIEVELYSVLEALEKIGKHLRLWRDQTLSLNIDFSQLTDEQVERLARGDDPLDVVFHPGES